MSPFDPLSSFVRAHMHEAPPSERAQLLRSLAHFSANNEEQRRLLAEADACAALPDTPRVNYPELLRGASEEQLRTAARDLTLQVARDVERASHAIALCNATPLCDVLRELENRRKKKGRRS